MYYDTEMTNQWYEDRRLQLAQTYADSQMDAAVLRTLTANAVSALGSLLIRIGRYIDSGSMRQQEQRLEPLAVRADNGN